MVHAISLYKIVVSEDCCEPSFQRGVQSFRRFLVFWSKTGFSKGGSKNRLSHFLYCGCWWMLLLDYKNGMAKNSKTRFFATPFLREGKGRKEERGQRSKKTPFPHKTSWGLKNGQEVVPPFWAQNFNFQIC